MVRHELLANRAIGWIDLHRHVRISHDWVVLDRWIRRVRNFVGFSNIDGFPLPRARTGLFHFPFVPEQKLQIAIIKFGWVCCPCAL